MSVAHYDAVVVGLGGVGVFALRALTEMAGGSGRFLGVEAASKDKAGFSSLGKTRIYRRAYFEHPNYVPWIDYSIKLIRGDLMFTAKDVLLRECGTLLLEPALDVKDKRKLPPLLKASKESAKIHRIEVETLDSIDLQERFPQFQHETRSGKPVMGLLEPGGGLLRPERIMRAALNDAAVAEMVYETQVVGMTQLGTSPGSSSGRIELKLRGNTASGEEEEDRVVTTDKLLMSMGGWTSQLIPSWKKILHPIRQVQGWMDMSQEMVEDPDLWSFTEMPTWVYSTPDRPESLYGIPSDPHHEGTGPEHFWMKVGMHKLALKHRMTDPHHTRQSPPNVSSEEMSELLEAIPHAISRDAYKWNSKPGLVAAKPCLYTVTADSHFVIGVPLEHEAVGNVFCVAGLSGHGYKMTPALGHMMADFALGEDVEQKWKTEFCSPRRFGV